jgi:hypothetical protein
MLFAKPFQDAQTRIILVYDEKAGWLPPVMTATFPFNLPSDCGISFNVDIKPIGSLIDVSSPWDDQKISPAKLS